MQIILNAQCLEASSRRAIKFSSLATELQIYIVNVAHKIKRLIFADIFIQGTAKIIGDIIFSVGKRTRAAKSAHNRAALASDTVFDFFAIYGAMPFIESVTSLEYRYLQIG
jgi:GMP synthase PP-ATPase subunit